MEKSVQQRALSKSGSPERAAMALGVAAGFFAALGYTSASAFLRALATEVDNVWVCTIKALCTAIIFIPWLGFLAASGKRIAPDIKTLGVMIFAGVVVQVGGNLGFQISLGNIGLALTVPIVMGSMVVFTALIGKITLNERVSPRLWGSLALLIVSISVLSVGVQAVRELVEPAADAAAPASTAWPVAWSVLCACISGFSFSVLGIAIRWSTRSSHLPLATPMVIVGVCGVATLGGWTWISHGQEILMETTASQWRLMWLASVSNSMAFLALTYALRILPVIYVNAINVTQVGMAALLGVILFHEPVSVYLVSGLLLMIAAFLSMRRNSSSREPPPADESDANEIASP